MLKATHFVGTLDGSPSSRRRRGSHCPTVLKFTLRAFLSSASSSLCFVLRKRSWILIPVHIEARSSSFQKPSLRHQYGFLPRVSSAPVPSHSHSQNLLASDRLNGSRRV